MTYWALLHLQIVLFSMVIVPVLELRHPSSYTPASLTGNHIVSLLVLCACDMARSRSYIHDSAYKINVKKPKYKYSENKVKKIKTMRRKLPKPWPPPGAGGRHMAAMLEYLAQGNP